MRWALAPVRGIPLIPLLIPCNGSAAGLGSGPNAQRQAVFLQIYRKSKKSLRRAAKFWFGRRANAETIFWHERVKRSAKNA
jgi:hypothetical protein